MTYGIATGHALTTASAEAVLRDGGTAVDAALAAAFTAFVVEPVLAGPLGAGVMLMAAPDTKPRLVDGIVQTPRGMAPEADLDIDTITVDFGAETQAFHIGAGTIATPCLMPMLCTAHERWGRMPLTILVAEACRHAREGYTVTPFQTHLATLVAPILGADAATRAIYFTDDKPHPPGHVARNPELADVLEVLAIEGPRFFAEGEIAQALLACPGGHLTPADLAKAAPVDRTPLQLRRGGTDIFLNPAPSLGGLSITLALESLPADPTQVQIAAVLDGIDRIRRRNGSAEALAAARPEHVSMLRALLDAPMATRGTTHISITDTEGMTVGLTLTNGEGCGRILPGTGIMPNNMLGEEDLVPDGPLGWHPDQRMATMMCPMILREGETVTVLGSGGSSRIRSALAQTALRLTDGKGRLEDAIPAPRLHVEGGVLSFEDTGGEAWRAPLLKHWPEARIFPEPSLFFGGVHAVRAVKTRAEEAFGDPRRAGVAALG